MYLDIEMLSVSDVTVLKMQPWFAKVLTTAKSRKTRFSPTSRAPTLLKKNSHQLYRKRRSNETMKNGKMLVDWKKIGVTNNGQLCSGGHKLCSGDEQ